MKKEPLVKQQLGQYYTVNAEYICGNLLGIFPKNALIFDSFAGEGDLLKIVKKISSNLLAFDIDPKFEDTVKMDTIKNPVEIENGWVITNPPYKYRTHNQDKTYYDHYGVDDLYKASLISLMKSNVLGGVLIIPLNFLSGLDHKFRKLFLAKYEIVKCNVFHEQVFADTTYTVCSFSFKLKKDEEKDTQTFNITLFPSKEQIMIKIQKKYGYQIGGELRNRLKKPIIEVKRLRIGDPTTSSQIYLRAIDSSNGKDLISLSINEELYFGKKTDRTFATIVFNHEFTLDQQQSIVNCFNMRMNHLRKEYKGLFLTNYREGNRKRVDFMFVYDIIKDCIAELELVQKKITSFFKA